MATTPPPPSLLLPLLSFLSLLLLLLLSDDLESDKAALQAFRAAVGLPRRCRPERLPWNASLPADLAALVQLRNLYLQDNSFSGEIPAGIFALQNLIRLNLGSNKFSSAIPANLGKLKRLLTLYLDRNQLAGPIPDHGLTLHQFNASYNQLNGLIPVLYCNFASCILREGLQRAENFSH